MTVEAREQREQVRWEIERENRRNAAELKLKNRHDKAQQEIDVLLAKVPLPDSESEDQGDSVEDDEDSDWEDEKEDVENRYNTMSLKNFCREVDRYRWTDRGAAKTANGLLRDLGLVSKGKTRLLICPGKVRREREKWGRLLEQEHRAKVLPYGMYSDGKKTATLVREETVTKVAVPGGRGRGAHRSVTSVSNKLEIQDRVE
jgi:hypothetical protein